MHLSYICLIFLVAFQLSWAKVIEEVPDVTRKIHGSYGAFRDFKEEDCRKGYENKWMTCSSNESPAFIYHWNYKLKGCERAIYKGCGATRNNFITERDCINQAQSVCTAIKG